MATLRFPKSQTSAARLSNVPTRTPTSSYWLFAVLILQTACQLGLLFEQLAPFRVIFRTAAFGINLAALFIAFGPRKQPHHPAFWPGIICLGWLGLQIINPDTNTPIAAIASWALSLAVIAPLFWVPRLLITPNVVRNVVLFFWGFHTLSSIFGVLQVYFPGGTFQPAVSQAVLNHVYQGKNLQVQLAQGDIVFRPMGLSDMPGGAANSGLYAFVFGLGLFSLSRSTASTTIGLISLPIGLFCIYLTQVRVTLVLAVIISIVYACLLSVTSRFGAAIRTSFVVPIVVAGAFIWAVALGGDSTLARFETLLDEKSDKLYYNSRGWYLEETLEVHLFEYPFGAGLGRWGMINTYFGVSDMLWAEIQWTGWVFDGGILLAIGYPIAMLITIIATGRVAFNRNYGALSGWALLILAYDVAMVAFTFSYCPFVGQAGLEFWFLNAMIWTAAQQLPRRQVWQTG